MARKVSSYLLSVFILSTPAWASSAEIPGDGSELPLLALLGIGILAGGALSVWKMRHNDDQSSG
jgi:hypothetical protein